MNFKMKMDHLEGLGVVVVGIYGNTIDSHLVLLEELLEAI